MENTLNLSFLFKEMKEIMPKSDQSITTLGHQCAKDFLHRTIKEPT
jgi:hypothetical protein